MGSEKPIGDPLLVKIKFPWSSSHIPKPCFDNERHNYHAGLQDSLFRDKEMYESMYDEVYTSLYQRG